MLIDQEALVFGETPRWIILRSPPVFSFKSLPWVLSSFTLCIFLNLLNQIFWVFFFSQLPYFHSDLTVFQFFDFSFLSLRNRSLFLGSHTYLSSLDLMGTQFIYLLTNTINRFSLLAFGNNYPILGQANYSPSLSNTQAAHEAEKIEDTGNT